MLKIRIRSRIVSEFDIPNTNIIGLIHVCIKQYQCGVFLKYSCLFSFQRLSLVCMHTLN